MLKFDINFLFTVINLLILYFGMRHFLFKPVNEIIEKRRQEEDAAFAAAKQKETEADALKTEYENSLKNIDKEREELLARSRKEAGAEYQKIVDEAKQQAQETMLHARTAADLEKQKLMANAANEIADMVLAASAKVSVQRVSEENDLMLYDKFLEKAGEEN